MANNSVKKLAFGTTWGPCSRILQEGNNPRDWNVIPIWRRFFERALRKEISDLLHQLPQHRGVHRRMQLKRESFKLMKRMIDTIVECSLVNIPDRCGRFSIEIQEGTGSIIPMLFGNPDLQFSFTRFWDNLVSDSNHGISKEVYIWLIVRFLQFLVIPTDVKSATASDHIHRLEIVAELDWNFDSQRRKYISFPSFCGLLYDLSCLWCDGNITTNAEDRCVFLNVLYDHVFFTSLPVGTPALIQRQVLARIQARAAPIDKIILLDAPESPKSISKNEIKSPTNVASPRRYEIILNSISYEEPASYESHNLYPSFPFRKIFYPTTASSTLQKLPKPIPIIPKPHFVPQSKVQKLPSYSKALASVVLEPQAAMTEATTSLHYNSNILAGGGKRSLRPLSQAPTVSEHSLPEEEDEQQTTSFEKTSVGILHVATPVEPISKDEAVLKAAADNKSQKPKASMRHYSTPSRSNKLNSVTTKQSEGYSNAQISFQLSYDADQSVEQVTIIPGVTTYEQFVKHLKIPNQLVICSLPNGEDVVVDSPAAFSKVCAIPATAAALHSRVVPREKK